MKDLMKVNSIININIVYPGTILVIPHKIRPIIKVNAYFYNLGQDAVPIVKQVGKHLTYLSPFAYLIKEDGNLQPIVDMPAIETAKTEKIIPIMAITNFTSTTKGENLAHIVLNSPELVETLITNIINTMKEKGYLGINIDFENVFPAERLAYNRFLQITATSLHSYAGIGLSHILKVRKLKHLASRKPS